MLKYSLGSPALDWKPSPQAWGVPDHPRGTAENALTLMSCKGQGQRDAPNQKAPCWIQRSPSSPRLPNPSESPRSWRQLLCSDPSSAEQGSSTRAFPVPVGKLKSVSTRTFFFLGSQRLPYTCKQEGGGQSTPLVPSHARGRGR